MLLRGSFLEDLYKKEQQYPFLISALSRSMNIADASSSRAAFRVANDRA